MAQDDSARRFRFGVFEADAQTGELRRQGMRVKLNSQPFQMLVLLLERPGELVTREEISRRLWPDDTFVDYEHGVNSAVNRIREALGDTAGSPRFVETLARRGYRFVAPVERIGESGGLQTQNPPRPDAAVGEAVQERPAAAPGWTVLATAEELPKAPRHITSALYVLLQLMYLAFYAGALMNLAEIEGLLSVLPQASEIYLALLITAAVSIPVRAFTLCAALFHPPRVTQKLLRLWPPLFVLDELWALAPFLLLHHINFGLALACTALLVYSPFAQRSLLLMGAGTQPAGKPAAPQGAG
jgi:DNA-binding winged helix-turn-helix (wHTH) protein